MGNKPEKPKFVSVKFEGNFLNVKVNISSKVRVPNKVYLIAPKLGITTIKPLEGVIVNDVASWTLDVSKLNSGTSLPIEIVSEDAGIKSESLTGEYKVPDISDEFTVTEAPAQPSNLKTKIIGNKLLISVETQIIKSALAKEIFLYGEGIGIPKSKPISGEVFGDKAIVELPINKNMRNRNLVFTVYLSNEVGNSPKLTGKYRLPNVTPANISAVGPTIDNKNVICFRGTQSRAFQGSVCPPGWKLNK